MKPSPHSGHLSQKELADLLNGKLNAESNQRVKKLLDDCELSKEALAGFTAVPSAIADIPDLKKQIAKSAGISKAPFWMNALIIAAGISLIGGITYVLWPREPQHVQVVQNPITVSNTNPETDNSSIVLAPVDLTPKAEHFVNPEAKPKPKAIISQGVIQDTVSKITNENHENIPVLPAEKVEVKPIVPEHPEAGYNGSVGFILDLKITEFEKYYRKTIEVREPKLTGIPAQFEDESKKNEDSETETVRNVPAEQFLNEGLRAFHDGKYGKCIEKMEVLKKFNDKDLNATFYLGVSYVKLEMFEKAITMFDEVIASSNNIFREEAKWYKALALIGNGNTDAAKQLLNEIAAKDGFYKEKAAAELRGL